MWGKPDALDRVAQALIALAALFALANGGFMLADPFGWYDRVDTVRATGPANGHFIRDIGIAYLVSGGLLAYAAAHLPMRWGSALVGTAWLLLHGLLHVWEVSVGICSPAIFWRDAPGVLGPPLLALAGIALMAGRMRISPAPIPNGVFFPLTDNMTYGLSPHLPDLARGPGGLGAKFRHFMTFAMHGHSATAEQLALARLGAALAEDCGPCVEIAARGALAQGVPRERVNAALAGMLEPGPGSQALDFGRALAAHAPELAELGEAIESKHGRTVRAELSVAAATARVHPALKRGLGFAKACPAKPLQL
jgi:alkylhydroperoxidase/carboxymuconolactone decarboxylase family protein YurZ